MKYNYKLLLILLFLCLLSMVVASCKSSKASCEAYAIYWENPRIDSLAIVKNNSSYIPFIPVRESKSLHINDSRGGEYLVLFKSGDSVIERRRFTLE